MTMLQEEYAIGDYINLKNSSIKVTEEARHHMVTLLEELNRLKSYKEETFYLACSLADRYLVNIAVKRQKAPCLIRLAIVCTLMSAKLE
jgi:acetamidase/formamidase